MNESNNFKSQLTGYYGIPVSPEVYSFQPADLVHKLGLNQNEQRLGVITSSRDAPARRQITVNGSAELSLPPDQVKLKISIKSEKPGLEEAKQSVHRRFEYIFQTLKKHKVQDSDIEVTKFTSRKEINLYEHVTEIVASFKDFDKYLLLFNLFGEKLDKTTVKLHEPIFSHSKNLIDSSKQQLILQAIRDVKRQSVEILDALNLKLGKIVDINQEKFDQSLPETASHSSTDFSFSDLISKNTLKITLTIRVTFDLRAHKKEEQNKK